MRRTLVLVVVASTVATARAQGLDYVQSHYTKHEQLISMRDGKHLYTAIYIPKDASAAKPYPILLLRTPYTAEPYGIDNYPTELGPTPDAAREGYIFVYQDVRGKFLSEGEYVHMRPISEKRGDTDESTDTWDTIDWLVKHVSGNNGRVGMWGISYPGFYAAAALVGSHPALKAVSPQAPIANWFIGDDFRHNGAIFLAHAFGFFPDLGRARVDTLRATQRLDPGTDDGYAFYLRLGPLSSLGPDVLQGESAFWKELVEHDTYDGYWQARDIRPHLKNVRPAVMTVGGWFDAEDLYGALGIYRAIEHQSPGTDNVLVMGPWIHGGWTRTRGDGLGCVRFGGRQSDFYRQNIEAPFFRRHLKGFNDPKLPEAYMFETGTNQWRAYSSWPPREAKARSLVLQADGRLAFDAPAATGDDEYVSDPAKPVPYIDVVGMRMQREYMVADQRFAARRPDVLVYQTEPLAGDVTLAGPIEVSLQVSTSTTDADFVVKLIDVYPADAPDPPPLLSATSPHLGLAPCPLTSDLAGRTWQPPLYSRMGGFQQLVRGEPFRGRFRVGFDRPAAFAPGQISPVAFTMPDVNHAFRRGHRIMVQVQSTWFPLVERNPQTFVPVKTAKPGDYQKATIRVHRDGLTGSRLQVMVLPTAEIPR